MKPSGACKNGFRSSSSKVSNKILTVSAHDIGHVSIVMIHEAFLTTTTAFFPTGVNGFARLSHVLPPKVYLLLINDFHFFHNVVKKARFGNKLGDKAIIYSLFNVQFTKLYKHDIRMSVNVQCLIINFSRMYANHVSYINKFDPNLFLPKN